MATEQEQSSPAVLVVDDQEDVADTYAEALREEYETHVAYGGKAALETFDESIDVVLLDRRMPDLNGGEVLAELRSREFDGPVGMVTAVDPGFDILEMEFDDYVVKPIRQDKLLSLVDGLVSLITYSSAIQRYYRLSSKKAALEANKSASDLENSPEYAELCVKVEKADEAAREARGSMSTTQRFSNLGE